MDNAIRRQNKGDTTSSLHIWSHYGFPDMKTAGDGTVNKEITHLGLVAVRRARRLRARQERGGRLRSVQPAGHPGRRGRRSARSGQDQGLGLEGPLEGLRVRRDQGRPRHDRRAAGDRRRRLVLDEHRQHVDEPERATRSPTGQPRQIEGGHAILFAGYRHKNGQRQFLVHNSWGKDWGDGGYAWISENAVRQFIKQAYKVVVTDTSSPPPSAERSDGPDGRRLRREPARRRGHRPVRRDLPGRYAARQRAVRHDGVRPPALKSVRVEVSPRGGCKRRV